MKKKIAVIAAHLGCGATMAKHIQAGEQSVYSPNEVTDLCGVNPLY